jgi:1-acyl-sn-glycerol-3-phosphate acyltransferase
MWDMFRMVREDKGKMSKRSIKERIVSMVLLVILVLNTMLWSLLGGLLSIFDRKGNLAHLCNRIWAKLNLMIGGFDVDLEGIEHVDSSRAYVIISNHQALFDIIMLLGLLPLQFRFVSKKDIFRVPFLGWAMRFARYIELDRTRLREAMIILARSSSLFKEGTSIMVFPEGTRSVDGRIRPFRKGPFQLALNSQVPILPVTILGTKRAITQNSLHIVPCPVKMVVSKPIEISGYGSKEVKRLMEDARSIIKEQFDHYCGDYYPFI